MVTLKMDQLRFSDFFGSGIDSTGSKTCQDCSKEFSNLSILEIHCNKVHRTPALLKCLDCNSVFKRKMGLILHYRTAPKHHADNEKLIGCDICDAFNIVNGFKTQEDLIEHTITIHGKYFLVNTSDQSKSFCPLPNCKGEFNQRKNMIEHLQVLHREHLIHDLLRASESEREKLLAGLKLRCRYCSKLYQTRNSLSLHLAQKHNDHSGGRFPKNSSQIGTMSKKHPQINEDQLKVSLKRSASHSMTSPPAKVAKTDIHVNPESKRREPSQPTPKPEVRQMTTANLNRSLPLSFASASAAKILCQSGTPSSTASQVECQVCHKVFSRQSILNVHSQMVHGSAPTLTTSNPLLSTQAKSSTMFRHVNIKSELDSVSPRKSTESESATVFRSPLKQGKSSPVALNQAKPHTVTLNQAKSSLNALNQAKSSPNTLNQAKCVPDSPMLNGVSVKNQPFFKISDKLEVTPEPEPVTVVKRKRGRPPLIKKDDSTLSPIPKMKVPPKKVSTQPRLVQFFKRGPIDSFLLLNPEEEEEAKLVRQTQPELPKVPRRPGRPKKKGIVLASKVVKKFRPFQKALPEIRSKRILEKRAEAKQPGVKPVESTRVLGRRNKRDQDPEEPKDAQIVEKPKRQKTISELFDPTYFAEPDANEELVKDFYGENLASEDLEEDCVIEGCAKRFLTYFSMMRHVAFNHRPDRTVELMKLVG